MHFLSLNLNKGYVSEILQGGDDFAARPCKLTTVLTALRVPCLSIFVNYGCQINSKYNRLD